jgi:hypothetical protein
VICKGCPGEKVAEDFYSYEHPNGRRYYFKLCRSCESKKKRGDYGDEQRLQARERWRQKNDFYKKKRSASIKERRDFIEAVKQGLCVDCEQTFPSVCMDFDHIRGKKVAGISYMAQHGYSLESIKSEIAKCELVCANCHRIRTWVSKISGHLKT